MTGADHLEQLIDGVVQIVGTSHTKGVAASLTVNCLGASLISRASSLLAQNDFSAAYDLITLGDRELHRLASIIAADPDGAEMLEREIDRYSQSVSAKQQRRSAVDAKSNALSDDELLALGIDTDPADGECAPELAIENGDAPFFTAILGFTAERVCQECGGTFDAIVVETYRAKNFLSVSLLCEEHARKIGLECIADPALTQESAGWVFVHEATMAMLESAGSTSDDLSPESS